MATLIYDGNDVGCIPRAYVRIVLFTRQYSQMLTVHDTWPKKLNLQYRLSIGFWMEPYSTLRADLQWS